MALPLFTITLFVSAFVLFLVQPMVGKLILPKLGGTPQVWNTCMVFFQSVLLAGYAYSHYLSTRFPLRRQIMVHLAILVVPVLFLVVWGPIYIKQWIPPAGGNPVFATLAILAISVGVPFFVVSTSAPLLQKWFSRTGHHTANDPYFLYSASNIGSLLSLVLYPFLIEPLIGVTDQTTIWTVMYVLLGGMIAACAVLLFKTPGALDQPLLAGPEVPSMEQPVPPMENVSAPAPEKPVNTGIKPGSPPRAAQTGFQKKKGAAKIGGRPMSAAAPVKDIALPRDDKVTFWRRLRWVLLAATPSSLMLGVTAYVSVDLSPFPLVWAIPLALYLLSFILVYSKWPTPWLEGPHQVVLFIQPIAVILLCSLILRPTTDFFWPMVICFGGFFAVALACHGELAKDRPSPRHLTEYFLLMSFGGMLGGFLNAIVAPLLFWGVVEFPLVIIASCFLRSRTRDLGWSDEFILKSFPNLEAWAIQKGDEIATRKGKPAPRSPYPFAYIMDVVHGVGTVLLVIFLFRFLFNSDESLTRFLKVIGFGDKLTQSGFGQAHFLLVTLIPMLLFLLYAARPLRFGLAITTVLGYYAFFIGLDSGNVLPGGAHRTYFGVLRVRGNLNPIHPHTEDGNSYLIRLEPEVRKIAQPYIESKALPGRGSAEDGVLYSGKATSLTHGTTHHGMNFHFPPELRRLATTYYHRWGPVGNVMERFNWWEKEKKLAGDVKVVGSGQLAWNGDARLPASMVGLAVGDATLGNLIQAWSEPPLCTIGLGTGTMASYGRPYQHVAFYEIDDQIRKFSEPFEYPEVEGPPGQDEYMTDASQPIGKPFFTYLRDATFRGSQVEVIMGDARLSMEEEAKRPEQTKRFHLRDGYYKVIVVDAFSSDAIPVHLITKEAILVYLSKLAPDGVICVHTSNRHVNLIKPVIDIADDLGLEWRVGKDFYAPSLGQTSSEYVMLARQAPIRTEGKTGEEVVLTYTAREVFKEKVKNEKTGKDEDKERITEKVMPVRSVLTDLYKIPGEKLKRMPKAAIPNPVRGSMVHWYQPGPYNMRIWTDDYTNILSIFRWGRSEED